MPHASHRMDLLIVPEALDQPLDEAALEALFRRWGVGPNGRSDRTQTIVEGGCRRIWLDKPGRVLLYANQSGGFRVRCPESGDNIAQAFGRAHRDWKAGGSRTVGCPSCDQEHPLEGCVFEPPAAFSAWAIVLSDVGGVQLGTEFDAHVRDTIGPFQLIARRP